MTIDEVVSNFSGPKQLSDGSFMVKCSAHEDRTASLHITEAEDRFLLKCQAGCTTIDVLTAIGLTMKDLFKNKSGEKEIAATYNYTDAQGNILYQAVRYWPKDFRVRRMNRHGGWTWDIDGVNRVLYNSKALADARPDEVVYVVEGEKDADTLIRLGALATTNLGGAGKWRDEYSETLRGRNVVILPDNDDKGLDHAASVLASLTGIASACTIVKLPNLPHKGDVSDWLSSGGTPQQLLALVAQAEKASHVDPSRNGHLRYLDLAEIAAKGIPPREWLIEPWIAKGDIALLAGSAGVGKSTLAASMSISLSSGAPWLCYKTNESPVLYIDEEAGESEISRLFIRLGGSHIPNLYLTSGSGLQLGMPESLKKLEAAIEEKRPGLVVLDTATHLFSRADENDAAEIAAHFRHLFRLRDLYGCAFLVLHHLRKPSQQGFTELIDRVRGSTSFTTQASTILAFTTFTAGQYADLQVIKRRGGGCPDPSRIEYKESDGLIRLIASGSPERLETTLDTISRFIMSLFVEVDELRKATIVDACTPHGHASASIERALTHLVGLGSLLRPSRGLYRAQRFVSKAVGPDELFD